MGQVLSKVDGVLRSLGGYALLSSTLALSALLATIRVDLGHLTLAAIWFGVVVVEIVTRGYAREFIQAARAKAPSPWDLDGLGVGHVVRVVGIIALLVFAIQKDAQSLFVSGTVLGLVAIVLEPVTGRIVRRNVLSVYANVPWRTAPNRPLALRFVIYAIDAFLPVIGFAFGVDSLGAAAVWLLGFASLSIQLILLFGAFTFARDRQAFEQTLSRDLAEYGPKFVLYWDAAVGTEYQVGMWIPYLERIGSRFAVVLRNRQNLHAVAALTSSPVIVRQSMASLEDVVVPSIKVAFYVNNAIKNAHFARFLEFTHIQLNHGDSDKPPSYNPVMRMYDRNFVAGPAAIERYTSRGIETHPNFFEIVGRPQIEGVEVVQGSPNRQHTVLYAPTWAGFMSDTAYSSLEVGPKMIKSLLARGVNVIFRPHPYSRQSPSLASACEEITEILTLDQQTSGRSHKFGDIAERELSVVDCFNASTAMIADVSSVVPDYLYSKKPFALLSMGFDTQEGFIAENPLALAGYLIRKDLSNLEAELDRLLGADDLRITREQFRTAYLGDFPDETYAEGFLEVARRYVNGQ